MARDRAFFKHGYEKSMAKAKAHVQYIGFRSRENGEEKGFFSHDLDHADYKEFLKTLDGDKALQHDDTVKIHKFTFSVRQGDYERLLQSGSSLQELVRETMQDMEKRKGMKLEWIASLHEAKGHPHIHVVAKATGVDVEGKKHRLRLNKDSHDHEWVRERFRNHLEVRVPEQMQSQHRSLDPLQFLHSIIRAEQHTSMERTEQKGRPRRQQRRDKSRQEMVRQAEQSSALER